MVTIVGVQRNAAFKIDGRDFEGLNLFYTESRDSVDGCATGKVFIGRTKDAFGVASTLKPGDKVQFIYNRFGKVDAIMPEK